MAKIERRYMAHFINAAQSGLSEDYVRLGRDLEEYSPELSANVEKTQNILGETRVVVTGYEKNAKVEPYYAEKGDPLFAKLQAIVDGALVLDGCESSVVEVHLWEEKDPEKGWPATREKAVLEVTSYGGSAAGYQIPFTVHYEGHPEKGWFDPDKKIFTAGV